jgi:enterochelin esterase family protein
LKSLKQFNENQSRKMKKLLLLLLFISICSADLFSQQALWGGSNIVSPEVHDDNRITFRLHAPNAEEVKLSGDWIPSEGWMPGTENLELKDDGVWEYTTEVLPSDLYTYFFLVDGLRMLDPGNVHVVRDVSSLFNMVLIEDGQGDYYRVRDVPHGTVSRHWYHSPGLEKDRRLTVYTPPGYEQNDQHYPVLYLLHGMGGDEEAWISLGRTAQILDNLIAAGEAEPMIVVMPNGNVHQQAAPGQSAEGFYQPTMRLPRTMDGEMEQTFPDIIRFTESTFRVKTGKDSRAIAGLSMGGFHSLHISRYHENMFDYVGLFSPAIMPNENVTSPVYDDFEQSLNQQNENGYELYWIAIGKDDFLMDAVEEYRDRLDRIQMTYEYMETEGGHTWKNWRQYITEFVPRLFK